MSEPLTTRVGRAALREWCEAHVEIDDEDLANLSRDALYLLDDLERAENDCAGLRYALRQIWKAVDAKARLDSGFTGMGHNILVEDAMKLRYATLRAKALLADHDAAEENKR
jgi:hypothetical protein